MASIRKRESSGKITYQVRWRADGIMQSATFPNRSQAVRFRGMVEAAGNQAPPGWNPYKPNEPEATRALTLAQWCTETIDARSGISERTRNDYTRILGRHLGTLGDLPLDEVTRNDIGRWVNSLATDLSPKTVANVHGIVSSCLQDAVNALMIPKNHAKGIGLPRADIDGPLVIHSASDFALIESHMDPYWLALTETLKTTGMRWGEATALTPRWMNLMARPSVRVVQAWHKMPGKGGGWELGPPKTKRSIRTITITDELRDLLLPLAVGKSDDDFVFTTKQGRPVNHAHFYNLVWRPALFAAQSCDTHRGGKWQKGMAAPEPCGCAGTLTATPRIHDYRHFHASFLIDANVPLLKISRRLGHESIQTTADVYGHLLPSDDDEILTALGQPRHKSQQSALAQSAH